MAEAESAKNGVYFLSLELENVRCFGKKQKLDLSDGNGNYAKWTVILGNNGIGKTTLLESFMLEDISDYESFIRKNETNGKITRYYDNDEVFPLLLKPDPEKYPNIGATGNRLATSFYRDNNLNNIYAYSATRKITKNEKVINYLRNKKNNYDELINAEEWLGKEFTYSEARPQAKDRFTSIKEILVKLLPDVTEINVYFPYENKPDVEVRFLTNGIWLPLNALSLGYQSMIAWVVDLAARLFNFYPKSPNPIEEPAIVLVDEIDLHLHPKWQREIMRYLSERFINTQFIVTAHSPLIVQAAEDENANIVVLRREGDEVIIDQQPKAIHGWRVDQLLASDLFGLEGSRSPKNEKLLKDRRAILSKGELTEADKIKLEELEEKIGDLPTAETITHIKAMDIIERAAKLLEAAK